MQKKIRSHRSQHSVSPTSDHCSEDRCHVSESRMISWIKMNSWKIRSIAHCTLRDIRMFTDSEKHRLKSIAKDRLCICLTTKWSAKRNDETRWRQQKHSLNDSILLTSHTPQRSVSSMHDHTQNACWWYTDITDSSLDSPFQTNSLMIVVTICFLTEMFTGEKHIDDTASLKQCRSRDNFWSWTIMNESMKITSDWNDTNSLTNGMTKSITINTVHWSHIDRNNSCFYLLHTIWQHSSCFLSERQSLQSFRSFKASTQFLQEFCCWRLLFWQLSDIRFFLNSYRKQHKILSFNSWHDQCERLCSCTNTWSEPSWKKTSRLLTFYAKNKTHPRLFFIWKIVQMKNIYCRPLLNKSEAEYKPLVENVHHILMLSRGWSNEDCNKVKLFVPLHDAFHRVFWNGTIQEQLFQLMWINSKWLTDEFKKDVMKILKESDQEYYYKNGVFRK